MNIQNYRFTDEGMKPVKTGDWLRKQDVLQFIEDLKKQKKSAKKVLPKK